MSPLGSAIGAWVSMGLHYHGLSGRVGRLLRAAETRALWITLLASGVATVAALLAVRALDRGPWPTTIVALATFFVAYEGMSLALRHPDAHALARFAGGR